MGASLGITKVLELANVTDLKNAGITNGHNEVITAIEQLKQKVAERKRQRRQQEPRAARPQRRAARPQKAPTNPPGVSGVLVLESLPEYKSKNSVEKLWK